MDEAGNHHSQQTNTGTENQHNMFSLIRELNNEHTGTQGEGHHTPGPVRGWGTRGIINRGWGVWGGIALE